MYEEQKKKTLKLKLELMGARNMKQNRDFEIERLKGQLEMVWKNYHKLEEENEDLKKKHEELKEDTQDVRMVLDDHRDTMILNQQLKSKITEMRGDQDELEEELEQWQNCTSYDDPDDVENEMDRLSELESCIHRVLWKSDTVEDDTDLLKLQSCIEELKQENEELKKKSEEGNFENIMLFIETWNVMGFRSIEKKEEFCEKYKISLKRFNEMYKIHNLVYKKNFMKKDDTFLPESQDVGGLDTE